MMNDKTTIWYSEATLSYKIHRSKGRSPVTWVNIIVSLCHSTIIHGETIRTTTFVRIFLQVYFFSPTDAVSHLRRTLSRGILIFEKT